MNTKKYNIGTVKVSIRNDGFASGLILKRKLTVREARYVVDHLLGINIYKKEDFGDQYEYNDYNETLTNVVNKWLIGEADGSDVAEYAYDCSDEIWSVMLLIPIIDYLKKKNIID